MTRTEALAQKIYLQLLSDERRTSLTDDEAYGTAKRAWTAANNFYAAAPDGSDEDDD